MKIGINAWSFPTGLSLDEQLALAKRAGFDGYEPALDETGPLSLESSDGEIAAVRDQVTDAGLAITSLATGLYWKYPCTSDDPAIRDKSLRIIKRQLEAAALLNVDVVLVVPGCVYASFASSPPVQYDVAWDRALEAISAAAAHARSCGVRIGVENVWNHFLLSPLEMRTFIDTVNDPYVGCYFDVGNVIQYGFPEHWIRILGSRILKAHVKDFRRAVGTLNGFVNLLGGDVDFPEVMRAFSEVGYDDYIIAEVDAYNHFGDQSVYDLAAAMRRIVGRQGG